MGDDDAAAKSNDRRTHLASASTFDPPLEQSDGIGAQSPSRKRPRLDMSADKAEGNVDDRTMDIDKQMKTPEPDEISNTPAATPSRVTINVRTPHKPKGLITSHSRRSSNGSHSSKPANGINGHAEITTNGNGDPLSSDEAALSPSNDVVATSSDVSDHPPANVDEKEGLSVEERVELVFNNFPYSSEGGYCEAAELISQDQNKALNLEALQLLDKWLQKLQACIGQDSALWMKVLYERFAFWEIIGSIYFRVFSRSILKQSHSMSPDVVESFARTFLRTFAILVARMLQADQSLYETGSTEGIEHDVLLSPKFVNAAKPLLREEKGFLVKILPILQVDTNEMRGHFISCFSEANGPSHLAALVHENMNDKQRDSSLLQKLVGFVEFAQMFGAYATFYLDKLEGFTLPKTTALTLGLMRIFRAIDRQLCSGLDKQQDVLGLDTRRTLFEFQVNLIGQLFNLTPTNGKADFFSMIAEQKGFVIEDDLKDAAIMVWKIKITVAYMTKGRMDLRIHGVDLLASELVLFFNNQREDSQPIRVRDPSPTLCYVADFLMHKKVMEFLFGVASHPQLIQRCSNIIGFLVVTNKFSSAQAQLIWRTIKDGQDPRVIATSFPIFTTVIKQLADFDENLMFTKMILLESLPTMSQSAAEFFSELLNKLRNQLQEYHWQSPDKDEQIYRLPLELCIELTRSLAPSKPQLTSSQITAPLFENVSETLTAIAPLASENVLRMLFESCIGILESCPEDGAAIAHAIQAVLRHTRLTPKELIRQLNMVSILLHDFISFIKHNQIDRHNLTSHQLSMQICCRLELIWMTLPFEEDRIDKDLLKRFWDHLVGRDALDFNARDIAWNKLAGIALTAGTDTDFFGRHKDLLSLTGIDASQLTPGFFQFAQKLATNEMRIQPVELKDDGSIDIPGLDLIWEAILRAPKSIADEMPLQYLTARYLDASWFSRASREDVEKTHVALVQESLRRLGRAFATLQQSSSDSVNGIDSGTGMLAPCSSKEEAELCFVRTMKFLKKFLLHVRCSKEHRPQGAINVDLTEPSVPAIISGDEISIKCDILRPSPQKAINRTLVIGSLDTCKLLHTRICKMLSEYNIASFQLITGGKRCYLREQPRATMEEIGVARTPHIIIRETNGNDEPRKDHIVPGAQWRTAFEQELVDHTNLLYGFLSGSDLASTFAREILQYLPRYEALQVALRNRSASAGDLFPPDQPNKTSYSIDCLRDLLESGEADDAFLSYGTRLLDAILPSEAEFEHGITLNPEVVGDTVGCLYDFVLAARGKDLHLFQDTASVQQRVIRTCNLALPFARHGTLVWDSYELLLDLCSLDTNAWQTFISNSQIRNIHEQLLLKCTENFVRRTAASIIQKKVAKWPPTSKTPVASIIACLWSNVSELVLQAVKVPQHASEVFGLALFLFKALITLEKLSLEEAVGLFNTWAPLLMAHHHEEFVGRDEPDTVLSGLSSLLRCVMETFADAVDTSHKIHLMQAIWWKFVFQKPPENTADVHEVAENLPVLETGTRMELVLLIDALTTNIETTDAMSNLLGSVDIHHFERQIDRVGLLRSPAGYLGLKNLGQTCYMNSLVTQLFMNPVFRAFLLSCVSITKASSSPLLHQTQRLFAIMQNSFHGYASAEQFTKTIVTLTEEKIDMREQMDVDEFMNTLFHRWEEQMPSPMLKERLRSIYTGKTVQQIKSRECDHVSEREDTCLAIPCDIQGNGNLAESLKAYIQGDVMEGDNKYKCERCNRLVDAVKRTCLKDIPDHLMLQLKRFAFDLETYSRKKINDLFEFPMSIDMSPYTFEQVANTSSVVDPDIFDLVGVIVHKGSAEHGHYVSYIRARPTAQGESPTWLLFDDADVTIFDPKDLGEACFGGPADKGGGFFQTGYKTYSAYMLFYQRRSNMQEHPWAADGCVDPRKVPVDADMEVEIVHENRQLLKNYALFDDSTREFVRCLISKLATLNHEDSIHASHQSVLNVIWRYLTNIWARTKDYPGLEDAINSVRDICANCNLCCYGSLHWFIKAQTFDLWPTDHLRDLLLRINQPKVRSYFRSFLLDAIKQIRANAEMYGADISEREPALVEGGAITVITRLAQLVPDDIHHNLRAWEDYFGLLCDIATLGPQECYLMISNGMLTACFEILLCNNTYIHDFDGFDRVKSAIKQRGPPPYNQLIHLAAILFAYIDMKAESISDEDGEFRADQYTHAGLPWTAHEEELLLMFNKQEGGLLWLSEIFQKWNFDNDGGPLGRIVKTLLGAKSPVVHGVVHTFINTIQDFEPQYGDPLLRSAKSIPMYLTNSALLDEFINFMRLCSRDANGPPSRPDEGYDGLHCYRFWSAIYQIAVGNLDSRLGDQEFFDKHFVSTCREWGPGLLMYMRDWEVGRLTQGLLCDALFKEDQRLGADSMDLDAFDKVIHQLFWGCDRQIKMYTSTRNISPWKQFMTPTYRIMSECIEHMKTAAEEEDEMAGELSDTLDSMMARFEEINTWYEELAVQSEDDHEVAQSNDLTLWEGLDNVEDAFAEASDLTEMSDDEMGSLLTTSLDG